MPGPPDPATTEWVPLWTTMNVGPVGPQGPQGDVGPVGPTGPQGIQGIQGPQGIQGLPGENWYSGAGVPPSNIPGSLVGDWYLNTTTGDVYEQTAVGTWTLRANIKGPQGIQGIQGPTGPTGATGPSGATAAHAPNHRPGGSDPLVNNAWTDTSNTFTVSPQRFSAAVAQFIFSETQAPVDNRKWDLVAFSQILAFRTLNDAEDTAPISPITMSRPGDVTIGRDLIVTRDHYVNGSGAFGGNLTANGVGGNVACKDQLNTFTKQQTIQYPSAQLTFNDTGAPVDARNFNLLNTGQYFYFQSVADNGAYQANCFRIGRTGAVAATQSYSEYGRLAPMGHLAESGAFEAYVISGAGLTGTMDMSIAGKQITMMFTASGVMAGGTPYIQVYIPGGFVSRIAYGGSYMVFTNVPWHAGLWNTGSNTVIFYDEGATPFPGGQMYIQGSISFLVN